ncbi:MAG: LuxR C-terminal-related transcriptional regulator [Nitrospiraceae bacterium]|nr:LuxR C-terminal-related transcriptional regulator [Nitrospiraceae bacterium]
MEDSAYLLLWIRVLAPLTCASIVVAVPGNSAVRAILVVSALDSAFTLVRLARRSPRAVDARLAISRDVAYAVVFLVANFHSSAVPALALAPVPAVEILVASGWRLFFGAVGAEAALSALRMIDVHHSAHRFMHPYWTIDLVVAAVASVIFGIALAHLRNLRSETEAHRARVRESLFQLLEEALAGDGMREELTTDHVREMIEEICRSGDPEVARRAGRTLCSALAMRQSAASLLTAREVETLTHMATGISYRKIASLLCVSEGTVRAHAASIMRKADVHTRLEAVSWARANRLIA